MRTMQMIQEECANWRDGRCTGAVITKALILECVIIQHGASKPPMTKLGRGVLARQEITFKDKRGLGFDNPMFACFLIDYQEKLMRAAVRVDVREKKP